VNVLLDTDIAIEILRAKDRVILSRWVSLVGSGAEIYSSPVVAAEIWAGARPQEHRAAIKFLDALTCLPAECDTGRIAGELLLKYARSHCLEVPDALIAGAAIQHRAALWTRNRKHYPMPQLTFY